MKYVCGGGKEVLTVYVYIHINIHSVCMYTLMVLDVTTAPWSSCFSEDQQQKGHGVQAGKEKVEGRLWQSSRKSAVVWFGKRGSLPLLDSCSLRLKQQVQKTQKHSSHRLQQARWQSQGCPTACPLTHVPMALGRWWLQETAEPGQGCSMLERKGFG